MTEPAREFKETEDAFLNEIREMKRSAVERFGEDRTKWREHLREIERQSASRLSKLPAWPEKESARRSA